MPDMLAASDVCTATLKDIPMFRTTYPNKVFDYMAAGRPTILAIDGVIRQVVEAARGRDLRSPWGRCSVGRCCTTFIQGPQQSQAMGAAARAYVIAAL